MVQADRSLDHRLQKIFLRTLQFAPHVFQHFVGLEEAAGIEELDAVLEPGVIHQLILTCGAADGVLASEQRIVAGRAHEEQHGERDEEVGARGDE